MLTFGICILRINIVYLVPIFSSDVCLFCTKKCVCSKNFGTWAKMKEKLKFLDARVHGNLSEVVGLHFEGG